MTEALWVVVIVNFLGMLTVWGKAYFDYKAKKAIVKKNKVNNKQSKPSNPNNPEPGKAQACIEHGKKLVKLTTQMKNLDDDLKEIKKANREDHLRLYDKINGMRK